MAGMRDYNLGYIYQVLHIGASIQVVGMLHERSFKRV